MLGLSLSKLLLIALVIAIVWYGLKLFGRRNRAGEDGAAEGDRAIGHDLTACPACGTYVATPLATCPDGRESCPMKAR